MHYVCNMCFPFTVTVEVFSHSDIQSDSVGNCVMFLAEDNFCQYSAFFFSDFIIIIIHSLLQK